MTIHTITQRIIDRSKTSRTCYLSRIAEAMQEPPRKAMSCSNLAHTVASCSQHEKTAFLEKQTKNIAIVTAYNDMLSAHAPYYRYPEMIKAHLLKEGMMAQVAGGVPAMCDGVTQGEAGMDLSLFSRDTIAGATAIALSHNVFDGAVLLGICDKIVPGLFMGLMSFGHLPAIFLPSGPMRSGISNDEKARIRQEYAKGALSKEALLQAETASYSAQGTCTFYGTANTNQMLLEAMGLQLSGSAFVPALSQQRDTLNQQAIQTLAHNVRSLRPVGLMIDEKSFTNAMVMLLATGGSTNHTIHLLAMARSCGIVLDWQDLADLSKITPLLARIYPNGSADVNHFHDAGGTRFIINELLNAGLMHPDVQTVMGEGLESFTCNTPSHDTSILQTSKNAFASQGGLILLEGNLGRAVMKTSSLKTPKRYFKLPAKVFHTQAELRQRFTKGELNTDFIAVLPFQGPRAIGMPELHALSPILGLLQDQGHSIALITDGRMSGASGKFPAAIHTSPEAEDEGLLGYVQEGDFIELDLLQGTMHLDVTAECLAERSLHRPYYPRYGSGRELFASFRQHVSSAQTGASQFYLPGEEPC